MLIFRLYLFGQQRHGWSYNACDGQLLIQGGIIPLQAANRSKAKDRDLTNDEKLNPSLGQTLPAMHTPTRMAEEEGGGRAAEVWGCK